MVTGASTGPRDFLDGWADGGVASVGRVTSGSGGMPGKPEAGVGTTGGSEVTFPLVGDFEWISLDGESNSVGLKAGETDLGELKSAPGEVPDGTGKVPEGVAGFSF